MINFLLLSPFLTTLFTAVLPIIEGKGAIVVGLALGLTPSMALIASVLGSSLPAPILLYIIRPLFDFLKSIPVLKKMTNKVENIFYNNAQKINQKAYKKMQNDALLYSRKNTKIISSKKQIKNKSKTHDFYVGNENSVPMKLKIFALFTFVFIPLPGTGVWTGSICACLLGIPYLSALAAIIFGNIGACLIVGSLGMGLFSIF